MTEQSSQARLAWLLARGGWRRHYSGLVAGAGVAGGALGRRSHVGAVAGAASLAGLAGAGLAALAAYRTAREVQNPPTRREAPRTVAAAPEDFTALRNPTAGRGSSAARLLPPHLRGVDVDSTDGSYDALLANGRTVSTLTAADAQRGLPPRTARLPGQTKSVPEGAVWLVPAARYHLHELGPLARELRRRGVPTVFAPISVPSGGLLAEMGKWTDTFRVLTSDVLGGSLRPRALLFMNDWGVHADVVSAARTASVPTFAKVEGTQDFHNVDTPRRTMPYTSVDHVLCQGPFDLRHRPERGVVVGSSRLEALIALAELSLREAPTPGYVVANLNFSYGTRHYAARPWLRAATSAAEAASKSLRVSVHPAVEPPKGTALCEFPLAYELERASALVTRSSTALFDAAALGTPVVYFNPHRERCWRDLPFDGDVPEIRRESTLREWLSSPSNGEWSRRWLLKHYLSAEAQPSEVRAADVILANS